MKKIKLILIGLVLLLVSGYSFLGAQNGKSESSDYIIINYTTPIGKIEVFRGTTTENEVVKCKTKSHACVIDLLSKFKAEGYQIISTTNSSNPDHAIVIFLGRNK